VRTRAIRVTCVVTIVAAAAVLAFHDNAATGAPPPKGITLTPIGVYRSNVFDGGGAEIAAYDSATARAFVVNLADRTIDILDLSDPSAPSLVSTIDVAPWGTQANSVAVKHGLVAVAIEAAPKTSPGTVAFFDADGEFLSAVTVGALPDMLTFTPNGRFVLVANEGEPNSYNQLDSVDPEGSVSMIDLRHGAVALTQGDVTQLGFATFNDKSLLSPSIRVYGPNATVAQDLEPEYIAVSHDSRTAWVTLQENNALAILDLPNKRVVSLVGLGVKDHSVADNGFDSSDRDGHTIAIQARPVLGMYQPDAIATFIHQGKTYLITANEGDVREWAGLPGNTEAARVSTLALDPTAFPNGAALKANASLGRLNVTKFNGNTDADPEFETLYSFGARSFSVWDAAGQLRYDSGSLLERLTAAQYPDYFNANHTNNTNDQANPNDWTHDSRSDDKGPEPEGVTVARLFGRQFAFIALERIGGVVIVDLTHPTAPRVVDYVNMRRFGVPASSAAAEDLGPEGLIVVSGEESPTGKPLLIVANEVSGTTRIFEIAMAK
jgi:2',3'-cyclic-nucleotide 2'-phosphodiesterase / 3'-nucleotidase / 5'-nucleotidase